MNKFMIYIPSKSRNNCLTANQLLKFKFNFKIVIEPQDYIDYKNFLHF